MPTIPALSADLPLLKGRNQPQEGGQPLPATLTGGRLLNRPPHPRLRALTSSGDRQPEAPTNSPPRPGFLLDSLRIPLEVVQIAGKQTDQAPDLSAFSPGDKRDPHRRDRHARKAILTAERLWIASAIG